MKGRGTNRDQDWAASLAADQEDLVVAFQRVRNLVHHRWWQALATRFGRDLHDRQVNRLVWGRLPTGAGQGRGRSAEADAAYANRLQGQDLMSSLDELAAVFWTKRGWEIARQDIMQPGHDVGSPISFDDEQAPK